MTIFSVRHITTYDYRLTEQVADQTEGAISTAE
jgi:hypothetical protein